MNQSTITLRAPTPRDEAAWRRLWRGYLDFYEAQVADTVTDRTWARLLDPASLMFGRLAARDGVVIGFSVSVLHEGSWTLSPICYLEDLFVDPAHRGAGAGRALIEDLIALARENGWSRLYWHTRRDNPARGLYDQFVQADDFVRYRLMLGD